MQYGCIGRKLGHSFSKIIHNKLEDYDYQLTELEPQALDEFMKERDFKAINVTIPYKQDVISYLDYTDSIAKSIGAVNTIVNVDGKLYGYNTDFSGMRALIDRLGIEVRGKKVAILGSGGTSKTAYAVADSMGAREIYRVSRSGRDGGITYGELYEKHSDTDVIINTTPCGMYPEIYGAAVDIDRLEKLSGVVDAVYNPLRTQLVSRALEKGIAAGGGLYMLVAQAVFAAEHFTGKKYERAQIDRIFAELYAQKENIVLVGMAGCGKSTLGRELAKRLGRELIDSDDEIVKREGAIPAIFERVGEKGFRKIESEVIREISAKSGIIIATGGGAVLDMDNVRALKMNGRTVFLDRAVEDIPATPDRPLSCDRERLTALYEKRLPIYESVADVRIKVSNDIQKNTELIINECFG
ncbi:MAG: AAA family ATPase [Clostridia bacterium]|nr:AAA family ATPase [Clostridia bacterium]